VESFITLVDELTRSHHRIRVVVAGRPRSPICRRHIALDGLDRLERSRCSPSCPPGRSSHGREAVIDALGTSPLTIGSRRG